MVKNEKSRDAKRRALYTNGLFYPAMIAKEMTLVSLESVFKLIVIEYHYIPIA